MNIKSAFVTTALGMVTALGTVSGQEKSKTIKVDCNPSGVTSVTHVMGNTTVVAGYDFNSNTPVDKMEIRIDNKIAARSVDGSNYVFQNGNSVLLEKKESAVFNKYREELYQISVAVCDDNKIKTVEVAPAERTLSAAVKVLDLL